MEGVKAIDFNSPLSKHQNAFTRPVGSADAMADPVGHCDVMIQ